MSIEPQVSDAPEPGSSEGDDLFAELTSGGGPARRRATSGPTFLDPTVARTTEPDGSTSSTRAASAPSIFARGSDGDGSVGETELKRVDTTGRGPGSSAPAGSARELRKAARLEARKVKRVVRHVEIWSVFKVSVVFFVCLWLILVIAGVILWRVAVSAGAIDKVENFVAQLLAEKSFTIDGTQVLRASAVAGAILVFAGTGFTVLMAMLFNFISDTTGGLRFSVIEMETARPARGVEGPGRRSSGPRRRRGLPR